MTELKPLAEKELHDFLCAFFQPDITGNEKKVWKLTQEIIARFGQPSLDTKVKIDWPEKYTANTVGLWRERYDGWNLAIDACKQAFKEWESGG